MFGLDIILIDLSLVQDFFRVIEDNKLSGKVSVEALKNFKENGYLKIWIDPKTIEVIAFTSSKKSGLIINNDFIKYLKEMEPLREFLVKDIVISDFSIDQILDKISERGVGSLTPDELNYLGENSK